MKCGAHYEVELLAIYITMQPAPKAFRWTVQPAPKAFRSDSRWAMQSAPKSELSGYLGVAVGRILID